MAFEGLSDKLAAAFKKLRSRGKLSEADVKEAMREVRLALLEADVNYKVAKAFTNSVAQQAIGANVTEREKHHFAHYLDCEAHTDVWRELYPTWNLTNEKD
jgi:signal recognition particle GTPase